MSYILKLDEEDKSLSKAYNEERKLTFWYVISKDMVFSVITGRSYRYDLYNFLRSPTTGSYLLSLKANRSSINLILQIILANLLQKVIQYVRRRNSRVKEIDLVEKEIEYWFKILEPEFNYQKGNNNNNNNDSISEIITSIHFDIIFSTLKIILYRHKPSSVITNRKKYYPEKLMNFFFKYNEDIVSTENIDTKLKNNNGNPYDFDEIDGFKYKSSEKKNYDFFLSFGYELLKRKRTKINEKKEMLLKEALIREGIHSLADDKSITLDLSLFKVSLTNFFGSYLWNS
ncbi:hypothetical protein PIROE2DRAFT_60476 [Piromyces sp. E2]|nr:hypothetical protein PIROE2DRAFT_60476 [Piromyces sp. E2]|eukprot:OUM64750.1 hypothetical protein PIROE2DRAFT_60476 [Piromyces sp. E2]